MTEIQEVKATKEPVKLEEKKPEVVVSFNLTDALAKAIEDFNVVAQQLKKQDEKIKKANDTLTAERNQLYTRAVELQGTVKYLQETLVTQDKTSDKK